MSESIIALIVALAVGVMGKLLERRDAQAPTEEAAKRPELRARLKAKVAASKAKAAGVALALCLLACGGCLTRPMIIVPAGEPVRLLESVKARVESVDAAGKTTTGRANIPAGWYCLPDPGDPAQ